MPHRGGDVIPFGGKPGGSFLFYLGVVGSFGMAKNRVRSGCNFNLSLEQRRGQFILILIQSLCFGTHS